jgi:protein phosphatase
MGSRAIVVVCKDADVAAKRFGVEGAGRGAVYTRTGRGFFNDAALEAAFLDRVGVALQAAGFYEELESDWFALDCELMPWSAKAQDLVREQYAAVGAAASVALRESVRALQTAATSNQDLAPLESSFRSRQDMVERYRTAYRRYCWPTSGLQGLKLAPFHILASEGRVHADKTHVWHMETLACLAAADPELLVATPYRTVQLDDEAQVRDATLWWESLTQGGGEGFVVKPSDFVAKGSRGLLQPAIKCRGREYLRIIYGPEYDLPQHLERLRERGLGAKRSLALREFYLGVESLTRFVKREPLRRVHECVFGVLALESEPVDPRL